MQFSQASAGRAIGILRRLCRRIAAWTTSFCKGRDLRLYGHCGSGFTIRLRPDDFCEPPRADPHAGWCGEGRLITVPYPIMPMMVTDSLEQECHDIHRYDEVSPIP